MKKYQYLNHIENISRLTLWMVAFWMLFHGTQLMLGGYIFNSFAHFFISFLCLKFRDTIRLS